MLVLHRRCKQSIQIGDAIEITVLETSKGCVRLGITAPANLLIVRPETIPKLKFDLRARQPILGGKDAQSTDK